ncbi:hypothetical protein [Dysgonomonas sp. 511]|uniref:hypothetical protein n=1 Tax=Dysgonomonas sp. 511 TaxID=2302930 RepID=UPI0013D55FD8|nr:hypothetical protein [Dysgonomonas sp. 511]NDV77536.1 hypothetical protein [Dysgonomonas sp. 511]
MKKALLIIGTFLLIGLLIFGYIWFYVPFSDSGVKAGILNNVKHKGIIFKTFEGELIQSGFRPGQQGLQSNEFQFSIENRELYDKLMSLSGQNVKLHYKEYFGILPWRGYTKYIVDSIVSADPPVQLSPNSDEIPPQVTGTEM